MSPLLLATIGGLISFGSTGLGSVLAMIRLPGARLSQWRMPIDFALGLMISAVAFSLVGPAAMEAVGDWHRLAPVGFGLYAGILLITALRRLTHRFERAPGAQSHLMLALVLMVHNFPEGLASGAALAGLNMTQAQAVLGSIALQNIPEGLLMVLCLRSLGVSGGLAFLGGVGSGVIELIGGVSAGFMLQDGTAILPFLLATAGGAMLTSVIMELSEGTSVKKRIWNPKFAMGLLSVPLLNGLLYFVP